MALNESQRKIAETTEGMMVADAGPGTGKTFTVVSRCINILRKKDPAAYKVSSLFHKLGFLSLEGFAELLHDTSCKQRFGHEGVNAVRLGLVNDVIPAV